HIHGVGIFRRHVGAGAVGQESDAAGTIADLHGLHHFTLRDVHDIDAVGLLGADIEPAAVGAPYRVLGVLAPNLDLAGDLEGGCVDDDHLVVFFDRRREP